MSTLALFDFDGTITRKDSFIEFLKYNTGKRRFYTGMALISPLLFLYWIKIIPNHVAKMLVLRYFLEGVFKTQVERMGELYCRDSLPSILRPSAIEKIRWHLESGHRVVLVSASVDWWLKPWCETMGIELISTRMKFEKDRFTGIYETPNCYGIEKVRRIRQKFPRLETFQNIYAYGDSKGDREMLALATHPAYQVFG